MTEQPCHVCSTPTVDWCARCERPTCADHFDGEHDFAICTTCYAEITASDRPILQWPYTLRSEREPSADG